MSVSTSTISNKADNKSPIQNPKTETKYSVSSCMQFAGRYLTLLAQCPDHQTLIRSTMKSLAGSNPAGTAVPKLSLLKGYEEFILQSSFLLYGKCDMGEGVEALIESVKRCLERIKIRPAEQLIRGLGLEPEDAKVLSTWPKENRALIAVIIELASAALTPDQQKAFKAIEKVDNLIDSEILISQAYSWLWLAEQKWKKGGTTAKVERKFLEVLRTSLKETFAEMGPEDAKSIQTEAKTRMKMDQAALDAFLAAKGNPTPATAQNMEITLIASRAFCLKKALYQQEVAQSRPLPTPGSMSPPPSPVGPPSRAASPANNPNKLMATAAKAPANVAQATITATKNSATSAPLPTAAVAPTKQATSKPTNDVHNKVVTNFPNKISVPIVTSATRHKSYEEAMTYNKSIGKPGLMNNFSCMVYEVSALDLSHAVKVKVGGMRTFAQDEYVMVRTLDEAIFIFSDLVKEHGYSGTYETRGVIKKMPRQIFVPIDPVTFDIIKA